MSEDFDWEGLKKSLPKLKHKTIWVELPDRDPPRVLSGVTPGIYPLVSDKGSKLLNFDIEAMIKPKTTRDLNTLLDEALSELDNLKKLFDLDPLMKKMAMEYFNVKPHQFCQWMDEKDAAHIEVFNREKAMGEVIPGQIESVYDTVFIIDNSCRWKNKHSTVIGHTKLINGAGTKWKFISKDTDHTFDCESISPYDCEREVVRWMVEQNLYDMFLELKE